MIKVRCSMVISPNGYIARLDGDEEWISEASWHEFIKDAETANNLVVGRKTYESVMNGYGDENFDAIRAAHKVVITNDTAFTPQGDFVVKHSPQEAVDYLRAQPSVGEILLAGGGELNAAFAKAGLIDVLELVLEPYVIGEGRPVLGVGDYDLGLELQDIQRIEGGRVRLRYLVKHPAA
jgi:dihydrofolate reductase